MILHLHYMTAERQNSGTTELTSLLYGTILMEEFINSTTTAEFIYRTRTFTKIYNKRKEQIAE